MTRASTSSVQEKEAMELQLEEAEVGKHLQINVMSPWTIGHRCSSPLPLFSLLVL